MRRWDAEAEPAVHQSDRGGGGEAEFLAMTQPLRKMNLGFELGTLAAPPPPSRWGLSLGKACGALPFSLSSSPPRKPDTVKQKNAFPPNFIHSLDSTHMMLTALHCHR